MDKDKNSKLFFVFLILCIFIVYLFTLPKGHWLIGLWNSFIVNRY